MLIPLLVVGLIAAGCGYALGLYLTRAITAGTEVAGEPPPAPPAPGVGDGVGAMVDDPPPSPGSTDDDDSVSHIPITIAPQNFYVVQLGAFSSAAGAQLFVSELEEQGYAAVAVTTAGGDRVWTGLFANWEQGRVIADLFAAAGYEAFVVERTLAANGTVQAVPQVLVDHLQALPGHLAAVTTLLPAPAANDAAHLQPAAAVEALSGLDPTGLQGNAPELARRLLAIYEQLDECVQALDSAQMSTKQAPEVPSELLAKLAHAFAETEALLEWLGLTR